MYTNLDQNHQVFPASMLYLTFDKSIEMEMHVECFKKIMLLKDSLLLQMSDEQMTNI